MTKLKSLKQIIDEATPSEEWRPIEGYQDYQVSDHGRVRSRFKSGNWKERRSDSWRILSSTDVGSRPYPRVHLASSEKRKGPNKYKRVLVHRLVAEAFIGEIPEGYHVAHLDGDPTNNNLSNLKICTPKENESHKKLHGTDGTGERNSQAKLQEWQVQEIKYLHEMGLSQTKIAALFDLKVQNVNDIVLGKIWASVFSRNEMPKLIDALELAIDYLKVIKNEDCCENPKCHSENAGNALQQIESILGKK